MQADISPIFCMAFTIVFFIDIINILLYLSEKCFSISSQAAEHLAVVLHGLNQLLSKSVLHNINTSKIECVKFVFCGLGAASRSTKRGGIIAPLFWFRKA